VSELAPIRTRDRIVTLDVLRGFALCGVLIGNLFALYSGRWALEGRGPEEGTIDTVGYVLMAIFVEGKAQNLLTFLFGFGFGIQLLRAHERHEPVLGIYIRRLLALLALGWAHVTFVWWGDVTWGYAISGFALLLFQRVPNAIRIAVGITLTIVPFAVFVAVGGWRLTLELAMTPEDFKRYQRELVEATAGTDYVAIMWSHMRYALAFSGGIWTWYAPALVGRFLLGYVAGVQRWFERDGAERLPMFRWMFWIGLGTGLPVAILMLLRRRDLIEMPRIAGAALYQFELLAMAATYIAAVVLLIQRPRWRRVLSIIAPAGRMPLTTYVLQSVFCTFLFYGWGLDLATPPTATCLGLALAIFAIEVAIAHVWLRYFRFGPLEWIWRTIVYWKRQPMRRDPAA
jgi:uncharacterized protein